MHFTDIFIKRPVLASVVSLFILLLGLRAAGSLAVREYPELQNAVISVTTAYVGADADLVQGFLTTPVEREVATAEGIDYITSSSSQGLSSIQAYLRLDRDSNQALSEIATKVNKLRSQLPQGSEDPVIQLADAGSAAAVYMSFSSTVLNPSEVTDYLVRVVEPQISTLPGIQQAQILGGRAFAMRIWLKPDRLTAFNLTSGDVLVALQKNNFLAAVGEAKSNYVRVPLKAGTDLRSAEEFKHLVVRASGDRVVRLSDVADVVLGSETYDDMVKFSGDQAIFIGITVSPDANVLDAIRGVREAWPDIAQQLPEGLNGKIVYDSTEYIQDAIQEVQKTLVEAVVIVVVVIFLFLGSMRSVIIPAVTVPLSLIGGCLLMLLMGFSINLLTLLAMVLAIGMVVDDAIIVLENVHRHIEEGLSPYDASIKGARELLGPVIAMTITLVAVYLPIGFIGGLTGKLFTEFAFTLAGAVLLSGVIALTLTPMMCSKLLKPQSLEGTGGLSAWLDARFEALRKRYQSWVHAALDDLIPIGIFGVIVLVSCYFLFIGATSELAPAEDNGLALVISEADAYASIDYTARYTNEVERTVLATGGVANAFSIVGGSSGTNSGFLGILAEPWQQRTQSTDAITAELNGTLSQIAGLRVAVIQPPSLPTAGQGFPVEFVISTTQPQRVLNEVANEVVQKVMATKKFFFLNSDLKIDRPQVEVQIDRDKAAMMGIDMSQLGNDLTAFLGGNYVNRFALDNRSYKVIPQIKRIDRLAPDQLQGYYTRAADGQLIPMSTLVTLHETTQPQALRRFQQMNAATLAGVQRPGVSLGEALDILEATAREVLPRGFNIDYAGQARQFKTQGVALLLAFGFAIVIIYLVLAAQFESFRDPLIMLVTVPMSICGALFFLNLLGMFQIKGATLNIYTQVGLMTLIGVISKHGILIVEFANQLQANGMRKRAAIEEASSIRLRPVLMTTAALVVAMIPLLIANGPGAAARFSMGLVIVTGMTVGTLFTLFVVPAMYMLLGRDSASLQGAMPRHGLTV